MNALHLHWSTKATFGDIDRAVDDAFQTLCYPSVREEQREALRCVLFGRDFHSQSVLAASLQDDSSTSSTMVTNSSHTSLVCFDHDRRSTPSFTVHCIPLTTWVRTQRSIGTYVTYARERAPHTRVASASRADTLPQF